METFAAAIDECILYFVWKLESWKFLEVWMKPYALKALFRRGQFVSRLSQLQIAQQTNYNDSQ